MKVPLRDQDGSVVGLVGIGRDVTERIEAEADLRKAKEFAENLIDTAKAIILGLDREGRVTVFNRTAEEITGYERSEVIGRNWFEIVVPKERYPQVWKQFEKLVGQADTGAYENLILTKSGEERHIAWNNSQILERGHVIGILSYGLDVTDRPAPPARADLGKVPVQHASSARARLHLLQGHGEQVHENELGTRPRGGIDKSRRSRRKD